MKLVVPTLYNLRKHRAAHCRAAFLIASKTGIDSHELVRCLRPWAAWLTVDSIMTIDQTLPAGILEAFAARHVEVVVLMTTSPQLAAAVRAECVRLNMAFVDSSMPPMDSRELALLQEVLHHDFELGGFNEWLDSDPQYSAPVLRSISMTHCRRAFPGYVVPHLEPLWQHSRGRPLATLDIGCGALSRLRWGALNGFLNVTGVDPLLDMYAILRERHGLSLLPEIACARDLCIGAEELVNEVVPGSYDFAYSSNALDHTSDPVAVIQSIASALRPGGLFALDVFTREGSRENWWQLHQFDIYVDTNGSLVCEGRDGTVRPLFPEESGLVVRAIPTNNDAVTAVVAERVGTLRRAVRKPPVNTRTLASIAALFHAPEGAAIGATAGH